jgi:predicted Fe-Mo cluster-binding NifX family protein
MKRPPREVLSRKHQRRDRDSKIQRAAFPVFRGRISPVLDTCNQMMLVESHGTMETRRTTLRVEGSSILERCRELQKHGVGVVICSAVSDTFFRLLKGVDIRLVSGIAGDAEEVIQAYRVGALDQSRFRMPGCA